VNRPFFLRFAALSGALSLIMVFNAPVTAIGQAATPVATANLTNDTSGYQVVGYFPQWGIYSRHYLIKDVETSGAAARLTQLDYAFANVSTDSTCYEEDRSGWGDASADFGKRFTAENSVSGVADDPLQTLKGNFNQIKQLKVLHPKLKAVISIGGYTWSGRFSDAALPQNRERFVASCISLFIKGNIPLYSYVSGGTPVAGADNGFAAGVFDGIDIDWEYPAAPGFLGDPARQLPPNVYRSADTQNYTALLAEFRKQLDVLGAQTGKHYTLTIAAPADPALYANIELAKIAPYLDAIDVMAYDIHGAWDATGPTNFDAPLIESPTDPAVAGYHISIQTLIAGYLKAGVPASKLVLGVPFYGRGWTGVPDVNHGLYQSAATMKPAPATFEDGIEDYKVLKALNFPLYRDPATGASWIFDGKTFWNYDDPTIIAAKMAYIKAQGLGGVMAWSLDSDDGTLIAAVADGLKP